MRNLLFCLVLCLSSYPLVAQEVRLQALFGSSAMLEIDGHKRLLKTGQKSPEGVLLLEATSQFARIQFKDREQRLTLDTSVATSYQRVDHTEVRLTSDRGGHFNTNAWVNGRKVEVMVDTGATDMTFNYPTAQRLKLDLRSAQTVQVSTASGIANAYLINLDKVTVGGITVRNVRATVHTDEFPQVTLLGNSFLSRVDMQQQNGVLILRTRY